MADGRFQPCAQAKAQPRVRRGCNTGLLQVQPIRVNYCSSKRILVFQEFWDHSSDLLRRRRNKHRRHRHLEWWIWAENSDEEAFHETVFERRRANKPLLPCAFD